MTHLRDGWAEQDPHTLLHRTARRRPRGDRRGRYDAGRGDGPGQSGRRRRRVRHRRDAAAPGDHLAGQTGHRSVRPSGRRGRARRARRADRSGGGCLAQCTEDDVDPRARTVGLAACGDAGACRVVSAAPPLPARTRRTPRTRRPRWCTTSPAAIRPELCVAAGLDPAMLRAGAPVDRGGRHAAPRRRGRARSAGAVRGGRRYRRRARRIGRGRCDRGRCRRRRHRYRRTGDDGRPRRPCATRSASSRPTAMRCPAHG